MAALDIRDIIPAFGVEVSGWDPSTPLGAEDRARLRHAFDTRGLLVLRGLDIDFEQQSAFCRMLIGEEEGGNTITSKTYNITNQAEDGDPRHGRLMFHADTMWSEEPFQVLSLYGTTIEAGSATTTFASSAWAYDHLPEDLRAQVEGLDVMQITGPVYSRGDETIVHPIREFENSLERPLILTHPRTGQKLVYVSQQTTRDIIGWEAEESEALLQQLFEHIYQPANTHEHHWQKGDLVVFDNIAMQHARSYVALDGPARTLRKVIAPVPNVRTSIPRYAKAG